MSQAFISYSRKDKAFVQKLQQALAEQKRDVWVDWEDIPPTAQWLREIYDGIEAAENFIFIISPELTCIKAMRQGDRARRTTQQTLHPASVSGSRQGGDARGGLHP